MLPRINRLKKKKDIEKVFKEGKGFKEGLLFLKLMKNGLQISRFGFVIRKKVAKGAVLRNKIKRRLREIIRVRLSKIKTGFDGVFVVLEGGADRKLKETEETIDRIFQKTNLF